MHRDTFCQFLLVSRFRVVKRCCLGWWMQNDIPDPTVAIEEVYLPNERMLLSFLDSAICSEISFASSSRCLGFMQSKNVFGWWTQNDVLDLPTTIKEKLTNENMLLLFVDSAMSNEIPFANSSRCLGFMQLKNMVLVGGLKTMFWICLL